MRISSAQFQPSYRAAMLKCTLEGGVPRYSCKRRASCDRNVVANHSVTFATISIRRRHVRSIECVPCTRTSFVRVHWHTNAFFSRRATPRLCVFWHKRESTGRRSHGTASTARFHAAACPQNGKLDTALWEAAIN